MINGQDFCDTLYVCTCRPTMKNWAHSSAVNLPNIDWFWSHFYQLTETRFVVEWSLKIPPHIATMSCKTMMSENQ